MLPEFNRRAKRDFLTPQWVKRDGRQAGGYAGRVTANATGERNGGAKSRRACSGGGHGRRERSFAPARKRARRHTGGSSSACGRGDILRKCGGDRMCLRLSLHVSARLQADPAICVEPIAAGTLPHFGFARFPALDLALLPRVFAEAC